MHCSPSTGVDWAQACCRRRSWSLSRSGTDLVSCGCAVVKRCCCQLHRRAADTERPIDSAVPSGREFRPIACCDGVVDANRDGTERVADQVDRVADRDAVWNCTCSPGLWLRTYASSIHTRRIASGIARAGAGNTGRLQRHAGSEGVSAGDHVVVRVAVLPLVDDVRGFVDGDGSEHRRAAGRRRRSSWPWPGSSAAARERRRRGSRTAARRRRSDRRAWSSGVSQRMRRAAVLRRPVERDADDRDGRSPRSPRARMPPLGRMGFEIRKNLVPSKSAVASGCQSARFLTSDATTALCE